jgi:hypothetical protein
MGLPNYAAVFAKAFFFAAHRFFMAMDSAFRPASVRPPFLTGDEALAGATLGVAATEAAAFFRFAQDFAIAIDIFDLNSSSSGGAIAMSYYEKWFVRLVELLVKTGLVLRSEVETGKPDPGATKMKPPQMKAQSFALTHVTFLIRPLHITSKTPLVTVPTE